MVQNKTPLIGTCELCGEEFTKSVITRHLAKCLAQHETDASAGKGKRREVLQFRVEGRYLPEFWLHLETAADSRFAVLDAYLRNIWLECCGHCSAFRLPEPKPVAAVRGTKSLNALLADIDIESMMRDEEEVMESTLASRVKVGDSFHYDYDFGSTTELKLKVVGKRDGTLKPGKVNLLARNRMPDIRCRCGKPAVWVCSECSWEPAGWLCKACGKKHECGDEMFLPVVNSPRVGVCGYTGSDDVLDSD
jgi:hypothetical protein